MSEMPEHGTGALDPGHRGDMELSSVTFLAERADRLEHENAQLRAALIAELAEPDRVPERIHTLINRVEKAEAERDRLAADALCALSAAGVATPEKGYVAEPHCLKADIEKLARDVNPATKWEADHQRFHLKLLGLADEFPWGCDAIQHVAEALIASRRRAHQIGAAYEETTRYWNAALECARVRGEALKCARETVEIAYNSADVGGSLARTLAEDIATIDAALAIQPGDPALAEVVAAREEVERVARRLFGPYEKQEPIAALNNALLRLDSARRKLGGGA